MLTVEALNKAYTTHTASVALFKDAYFTLASGANAAITGPSGCGKSTFLHMLGSLTPVDSGAVTFASQTSQFPVHAFDEQAANAFRRDVLGLVYQKFNLIDFLSVKDNIYLTAQHKHAVDDAHIHHLITELGLAHLLDKTPAYLSGGEQQRVAIARALAHKPQLVLADEPTGNLDPVTSQHVCDMLFGLSEAHNVSLIVVTHSEAVAARAQQHYVVKDQTLQIHRE